MIGMIRTMKPASDSIASSMRAGRTGLVRAASVVAACLLAGAGAAAQPADAGAVESMSGRWAGLGERLSALEPSEPEGYFLLGEEVAAEAMTGAERALARRLHALAFGLASRQDRGDDRLRASAALALADLARTDEDRAWLRAIARSLRPPESGAAAAPGAGGSRAAGSISREAGHDAARALGLLRSGDGREAGRLLARDEVEGLLERYSGLITETGPVGLMHTLRTEARSWPDDTCRDKRYIVAQVTRNGEQTREIQLCPVCGGSPGWAPEPEIFRGTLRLESKLLDGVQRSWSAQLAADGGAVLRDPDPENLPASLGYEVARSVWRGGRWVSPAAGMGDG